MDVTARSVRRAYKCTCPARPKQETKRVRLAEGYYSEKALVEYTKMVVFQHEAKGKPKADQQRVYDRFFKEPVDDTVEREMQLLACCAHPLVDADLARKSDRLDKLCNAQTHTFLNERSRIPGYAMSSAKPEDWFDAHLAKW